MARSSVVIHGEQQTQQSRSRTRVQIHDHVYESGATAVSDQVSEAELVHEGREVAVPFGSRVQQHPSRVREARVIESATTTTVGSTGSAPTMKEMPTGTSSRLFVHETPSKAEKAEKATTVTPDEEPEPKTHVVIDKPEPKTSAADKSRG